QLAADAQADPDALAARLANLGPLAAPLVQAALEGGPAGAKAAAAKARDLAVARFAKLLSDDADANRRFAADALFGLGDLATPALEKLATEGGPDERHRAERLLRRIRWSISEDLYRRTGTLLEGFEALPWRDRRFKVYELEKQGGAEAIPTLRVVLEKDPSPAVRVTAAECLARQGDPVGLLFLRAHDIALLTQEPGVIAAIAMDQGIRYLQIRRYEKALEEFQRVLALQPDNDIAHYNLACAFALRFARDQAAEDKDRAFEHLERSIQLGFDDDDHIAKDSDLDALHDDPRFHAIVEKLRAKKAQEKP
ncbi:MAG TPA: HEAT repeat domain-containing protein, partial [Planctomycetota bacterium]|nr:HEAT repeat domain-containing protein [Planctomycetota bacterium]